MKNSIKIMLLFTSMILTSCSHMTVFVSLKDIVGLGFLFLGILFICGLFLYSWIHDKFKK